MLMRPLPHVLPFYLVLLFLSAFALSACGEQEAYQAYEQGQQALAQNDFQNARTHFDHALALDSSYARAYLGRGQLHWQQQQYEQALSDLNRAIELDPHLIWGYYLRGVNLMAVHRYKESLADFDQFIAAEELVVEDRVRAHRWRGIALLNLEQPEDALVEFSECIALQPIKAFHRKERARIYEGLGQIDAAIADYEAYLVRLDEDSEDAHVVQHRLDSLRVLL